MKLPTLQPEQTREDRDDDLAQGRWRPQRGRGFKIAAWAILAMIALGTLIMVLTILREAWSLLGRG